MAIAKMGKLVEVDIRKLWGHEQYDFSNWPAAKDNLELLNEAIGLTLSEVEKEVYVGHGTRTDNGNDTYGMPMDEASKMFPGGCDDYGISIDGLIAQEKMNGR